MEIQMRDAAVHLHIFERAQEVLGPVRRHSEACEVSVRPPQVALDERMLKLNPRRV